MTVEPFVKCSDIIKSLEFYTRILDFTVRQAPDPDPAAFMSKYASIERASSIIHLSAHAGDGVFGSLNYVRVNNLDVLFERFIENGLNKSANEKQAGLSMKPVVQTWGMREFSVRDPDSNKWTFGEEYAN